MSSALSLARVVALVGPYGSGKTELAIGLAIEAARQVKAQANVQPNQAVCASDQNVQVDHLPRMANPVLPARRTVLADLDVMKPYFRSREAGQILTQAGVELIAPPGALHSDLPIVSPQLRGSLVRQDTQIILDVGGDAAGTRALGSLADSLGQTNYDLLLVLNRFRPFMETHAQVMEQAVSIAAAASLSITGVISNTHLMEQTSASDVEWGLDLARAIADELKVKVRFLALPENLCSAFENRSDLPPRVSIRRQMMPSFLGGVVFSSMASTSNKFS